MNKVSIKGLSELLQVDYADSRGLVKVLEKLGYAKEVDKQRPDGVKGKPTTFYQIDSDFMTFLTSPKQINGFVKQVVNQQEQPNKELVDLSASLEM